MSYLHHWKTLLGTRWALKCHCWGRCCPDCVPLVQAALLSRNGTAGSAPSGFLQEAALCTPGCSIFRAFCTCGVSGAESSHTQELAGPFSSTLPTLSSWLGTSSSAWEQTCLSLKDGVKSCDTKKPCMEFPALSKPALHPAETPHSLPAESLEVALGDMQEQRLVWELKLLIKTILEPWSILAPLPLWVCSPSPLMRSEIPDGQLWASQCSALCCNHHAEPWLL